MRAPTVTLDCPRQGASLIKALPGFLHFWRLTTAKTTREKQERLVGLEAAQQKEAETGVDTRHSPPNWTRPAAIALLRNTTPRSSELSTGGNQSCPGHEIVINES